MFSGQFRLITLPPNSTATLSPSVLTLSRSLPLSLARSQHCHHQHQIMTSPRTLLSLSALLLVLLLPEASSHSFMITPRGDYKTHFKAECRLGGPPHDGNDLCRGPCIAKNSWQYNRRHRSTTYRRGQYAKLEWSRNNHHGGFVRFSIVPASQRMSHAAHNAGAFYYTCYEAGLARCWRGALCGTDVDKKSPRVWVKIPTWLRDGDYVLGWAWFGGLHDGESYFGDYWSCADVKIRGGVAVTRKKPAVFKAGRVARGVKGIRKNSCIASVNRLGTCRREPCLWKGAHYLRPAGF